MRPGMCDLSAVSFLTNNRFSQRTWATALFHFNFRPINSEGYRCVKRTWHFFTKKAPFSCRLKSEVPVSCWRLIVGCVVYRAREQIFCRAHSSTNIAFHHFEVLAIKDHGSKLQYYGPVRSLASLGTHGSPRQVQFS